MAFAVIAEATPDFLGLRASPGVAEFARHAPDDAARLLETKEQLEAQEAVRKAREEKVAAMREPTSRGACSVCGVRGLEFGAPRSR